MPHFPRSASQEGFEHSPITTTTVAGITTFQLGEYGVRVNAICPGGIATSILGRAAGLDSEQAQSSVDTMTAALGDIAAIRRSGQPIDIAEGALWLASDASSYLNGQAIAAWTEVSPPDPSTASNGR
jgi:NAD(P)-dependent dehydrogenase (short-subunit alcohol dehydrogenase family)